MAHSRLGIGTASLAKPAVMVTDYRVGEHVKDVIELVEFDTVADAELFLKMVALAVQATRGKVLVPGLPGMPVEVV